MQPNTNILASRRLIAWVMLAVMTYIFNLATE